MLGHRLFRFAPVKVRFSGNNLYPFYLPDGTANRPDSFRFYCFRVFRFFFSFFVDEVAGEAFRGIIARTCVVRLASGDPAHKKIVLFTGAASFKILLQLQKAGADGAGLPDAFIIEGNKGDKAGKDRIEFFLLRTGDIPAFGISIFFSAHPNREQVFFFFRCQDLHPIGNANHMQNLSGCKKINQLFHGE
jgi:hypothetical protein